MPPLVGHMSDCLLALMRLPTAFREFEEMQFRNVIWERWLLASKPSLTHSLAGGMGSWHFGLVCLHLLIWKKFLPSHVVMNACFRCIYLCNAWFLTRCLILALKCPCRIRGAFHCGVSSLPWGLSFFISLPLIPASPFPRFLENGLNLKKKKKAWCQVLLTQWAEFSSLPQKIWEKRICIRSEPGSWWKLHSISVS